MAVHLAKGTRDLLPDQMAARLEVIDTVRSVFTRHGFEPLETPALERIETLLGKYGDETDKLMFRILKRGRGAERGECDLGLRYDLTVPLARVVAMNPGLRMPFRRYQIQPVWRADRPQRGRFREFTQCDVDVLGAEGPLADAECVVALAAALTALGFTSYSLRLNDRRILTALARRAGASTPADEASFLISLDKLDKIGRSGVEAELAERGLTGLDRLWAALDVPQDPAGALAALARELGDEVAEPLANLARVVEAAAALGMDPERLVVDPSLARGADYYTGTVFEVWMTDPGLGALAGGGRYDGLVGRFAGKDVPAVGGSLGLERILTVMEELGMLRPATPAAEVLVTVHEEATEDASLRAVGALRAAGVAAELYVGSGHKLRRQLKYANARGYPWIALVGPDEVAAGVITVKHMASGEQSTVPLAGAADHIRRGASTDA